MKDISTQVKGLSTDHKFNNLCKVLFYVGIGLFFYPYWSLSALRTASAFTTTLPNLSVSSNLDQLRQFCDICKYFLHVDKEITVPFSPCFRHNKQFDEEIRKPEF